MRLGGLPIATLLLLGACPEGGVVSSFDSQYADAYCSTLARCGSIGASEKQACVARWVARFRDGELTYNADAAVRAGYLGWDDSQAARCVDATRTLACTERGRRPSACLLITRGLVADGGGCRASGECASTVCYQENLGCKGRCLVVPDPCARCRVNQRCDAAHTCVPRLDAGAACTYDNECQIGLRCGGGNCRAYPAEGEPCVVDGGGTLPPGMFDVCAAGLWCDSGGAVPTCRAGIVNGGACGRSIPCADGLACVGLDSGSVATTGTCTPFLDVDGLCGTAASTVSTACPLDMLCDGSHCKTKYLGEGDGCGGAVVAQCGPSLYCEPTSGRCAAQLAQGSPCDSTGSGCLTGDCDPTSRTCRAICD